MKPTTASVATRLRAPIVAAASLAALGWSLCAMSLPAAAGDLDNGGAGGIKDYGGGGTPVPAPVPYEENFQWYIRGDIGSAFKNTGTFPLTGGADLVEPNRWTDLSILSIGFGRYVAPNFRVEYSLDYRPQRNISTYSTQTHSQLSNVQDINNILVNYVHQYNGTTTDYTTYQNESFLMSAFYDFNREGKFHPYVGGGIGIAAHQLQRNSSGTMPCTSGTYHILGDPTPPTDDACAVGASGLPAVLYTSSIANMTGYGLAGQLSAGLSYDLSSRIHWDTGYRMLWQSGHIGVASADGLSAVHVGDTIGHEVRTGVRWDLW